MTPNPECVSIDTPIVDALHTMHDGKFLHLPVLDKGNEMIFRRKEEVYALPWSLIRLVENRWKCSCCG